MLDELLMGETQIITRAFREFPESDQLYALVYFPRASSDMSVSQVPAYGTRPLTGLAHPPRVLSDHGAVLRVYVTELLADPLLHGHA